MTALTCSDHGTPTISRAQWCPRCNDALAGKAARVERVKPTADVAGRYVRHVETPKATLTRRGVSKQMHALAEGRISATQGKHSGGPCPAVALATVAGKSYGWAYRYLNTETGYTGSGEYREPLDRAAAKLFGPGRKIRGSGNVGRFVGGLARTEPNANGFAYCRGHVMPIRNGRLLNASAKHLRLPCEGVTLFDIVEVRD